MKPIPVTWRGISTSGRLHAEGIELFAIIFFSHFLNKNTTKNPTQNGMFFDDQASKSKT
jgi:hypothetical protein